MIRKWIILLVLLYLMILPVQAAQLPRIVDNADLLTGQEEIELEEAAADFRDQYALDCVILTVDSLNGIPISVYADDYYDTMGYGVGSDYSGFILVVSMAERELYISTCGEAINRLSDAELDKIIDGTSQKLGEGEYAEAFSVFLGLATLNIDFDNYAAGPADEPSVNWFLSLLIGIVAAAISVLVMRSKMNTARAQSNAISYVKDGSYSLNIHRDMFLYRQVTKTPKPQNNGGTSVHRSSSGRSHGGRGGKF